MDKVSKDIEKVEIGEEFRECPQCGYQRGFHVSFLADGADHRLVLICPSCGARYDVGKTFNQAI